jgi:hypothetical protein
MPHIVVGDPSQARSTDRLGTVLTERYPGVWVADAADELLPDAEQRSHSPRRAFLAGHIPPGRLGRNDPDFRVTMIRGRDAGGGE